MRTTATATAPLTADATTECQPDAHVLQLERVEESTTEAHRLNATATDIMKQIKDNDVKFVHSDQYHDAFDHGGGARPRRREAGPTHKSPTRAPVSGKTHANYLSAFLSSLHAATDRTSQTVDDA